MDHLRIGLIWRYSDPHCIKLFCSILQEKQYRFTTCFKTCGTGYKKVVQSIFLHSKIKLMCDSHFLPCKQTRLLNFVDYQQYFQNNAVSQCNLKYKAFFSQNKNLENFQLSVGNGRNKKGLKLSSLVTLQKKCFYVSMAKMFKV